LIGDFVPYIWLTNSDRAFLWLADNDKGWITDDDKSLPTQELIRADGKVTLRVHFIEVPTELKGPTSLTYGYQTFPSRPLPKGWRTIICGQSTDTLPSARNTYFWYERQADWAVLWPYYSSPFPWSMEKSAKAFARYPKDTDHRPMVGSIAHAVARYQDYDGHQFPGFVVDWGNIPGDRSNGNTTQGKGPVDFRVWHYQRWVREAGFRGVYVDENYLGLSSNFLTGGAYIRSDQRLQRGYCYLGLREYFKRMKVMFHQNGAPPPNLWQHISSGAAHHSWFGDIFFEGENVEPSDLTFDYMEVLPAGRMRAIGSSACAGGAMTMMCQSQRHATVYEPKHTHQFVGWVMAHDVLPEQVTWYNMMAQEGRLYADDVEFVGYWKDENPVKTSTPDCIVSIHKTKDRALLWVVNTSRQDKTVDVAIDFAKLGFDKSRTIAVNAETGELLGWAGAGLRLPVLKRDFAAVHLVDRQVLTGSESFYASFDKGVEADEALGCSIFEDLSKRRPGEKPGIDLIDGVKGKAAAGPIRFWPRLQLSDSEGRIVFSAKLPAKARGVILDAGLVSISATAGKESAIVLASDHNPMTRDHRGQPAFGKDKNLVKTVSGAHPGEGWHEFDLSWKGGKAALKIDGKPVAAIALSEHGLGIGPGTSLGKDILSALRFTFGGRGGAEAFDEIRCYRKAD
ncbi:MAG TPA: glycoside hydrolase domain-containing protein, partial [Phycisphaerae bacterium]|nr:glycoside hydrolase domain-containing protein [Phycisphaerae bacterium]